MAPTMPAARDLGKPLYYEDGGLRKVVPYTFAYEVHAKQRWIGKTVLDVFSYDFKDRSPEYYEHAIRSGSILVQGEKVDPSYVIRNNDLLRNVAHRHEPPVCAGPITIVAEDKARGLLVVEKPGSMPVHPTGRYNFNTLLEILKHVHGYPLVHTANRLDRLTSGVMVCSTSVDTSRWLTELFAMDGEVKKEYVCRAVGLFPDGEVICEEPLLTLDRQLGVNVVHPDGRPAKTIFRRLSYHARTDTSVILCRPITGRSHQIRVHLQFLGHPIANDPIYSANVWGRQGGTGGFFRDPAFLSGRQEGGDPNAGLVSSADLHLSSTTAVTPALHTAISQLRALRDLADPPDRVHARDQPELGMVARDAAMADETEGPFGAATPDYTARDEHGLYCRACGMPVLDDPRPEHLFIWLHASRYSSERGQFDYRSTVLPAWARESFDGEIPKPLLS